MIYLTQYTQCQQIKKTIINGKSYTLCDQWPGAFVESQTVALDADSSTTQNMSCLVYVSVAIKKLLTFSNIMSVSM